MQTVNSVKTVPNSAKQRCVLIPLGSPTPSRKRSYVHVPGVRRPWHQRCTVSCRRGMGPGGYTGVVYRVGTGEGYTGTQPAARGDLQIPAKRARSPAGGGVVGIWRSGALGDGGQLPGPPCGPGRVPGTLPVLGPAIPALQPIGRDSITFSIKLVKTAKCHQECRKRPVIVPIFQNGSQMSALEIPRFPFSVAFSHKELMGLF